MKEKEIFIATKRIKYLWINLPKETKDLYGKNYKTDERNQRLHKWMERHTMFLDWKNQYCENDYTTLSNLQIQFNPYQNTSGYFSQNKKFQFVWKHKRQFVFCQSNLEKEKMELEESTFLTSNYTTKLQSSRQYDTGTKTEI